MKRTINTVCVVIILGIIGSVIIFNSLVIRVPLGQVGVRIQQFALFGEKGVIPQDFGVGFHRSLGFIDSWVKYDATVQTLELTRDPTRGDRRQADDVQITTADGYRVSMDLTVKYRIKPGQAHQLYAALGPEDRYKSKVRELSLDAFRSVYGKMKTEDFYNPELRKEYTSQAFDKLSAEMNKRYVEVLDILVRDVQYDDTYVRKIRDKKLADQEVELNKSKALAAEMQGKTNVIREQTQALVKVIKSQEEAEIVTMKADTEKQVEQIAAEARIYGAQKKADADLYAAELIAKGDLLEREAMAKGDSLKAQALTGSGGSNYVAREAVTNIRLGDVSVSSIDIPFLEVDKMVEKLGARGE